MISFKYQFTRAIKEESIIKNAYLENAVITALKPLNKRLTEEGGTTNTDTPFPQSSLGARL